MLNLNSESKYLKFPENSKCDHNIDKDEIIIITNKKAYKEFCESLKNESGQNILPNIRKILILILLCLIVFAIIVFMLKGYNSFSVTETITKTRDVEIDN